MNLAWNLGNWGGTTIRVHATFWLIVAWVALGSLARTRSLGAVGADVAFLLTLFGCVLLHELGHALAARRYGIRTPDITLLPIGGVARLERMPERPSHELVVALAGPAVNVAIVLAIAGLRFLTGQGEALRLPASDFLSRLAAVNLFLALFNLLPAFPMDGGRVLRAALAARMEFVRATEWAVGVGRGLAVLFVLGGLAFQPFLALIGVFVWLGGGSELRATRLQHALRGVSLQSVMDTKYVAFAPDQTLAEAAEAALTGRGETFPVVDRGTVVGLVTESKLRASLREQAPDDAQVQEIMDREFVTAESSEPLEAVLSRMMSSGRAILVLHDEMLAGLVTPLRLARVLELRGAGGT